MRKRLALLVALALAGCYAQLEEPSVSVTRPICDAATPNCIVGAGLPLDTIQASGRNTFKIPLGNQDLFKPETALGPTKLTSHLILNQAVLVMTTDGVDFNGFIEAQVLSAPQEATSTIPDPCAAPTVCRVLAKFDRQTQGPADRRLVLKGTGTDLIPLIDQVNHQVIIEIHVKGTAPGSAAIPQWGADITIDMGLSARANYP